MPLRPHPDGEEPRTQHSITARDLSREIDEALQLLGDYRPTRRISKVMVDDASFIGLLEQCNAFCAVPYTPGREPVRTIHHFACTGGTLICKCVSAMPNVQLFSEIDPLAETITKPGETRFAPTDLILQARQSTRGSDTHALVELFLSGLDVICTTAERKGYRLVLRDHAHSQFCTNQDASARPTLREMVAQRHELLSIVTVRDPLESFAALSEHGWMHFKPGTYDEYCARYLRFLQRHEGIPIFKYEDFVGDPSAAMRQICSQLELPYQEHFISLFNVFKLTGDSGRRGESIAARNRRPVSDELKSAAAHSENSRRLRELLQYDSVTD